MATQPEDIAGEPENDTDTGQTEGAQDEARQEDLDELHDARNGKRDVPAELGQKPTLESCDYDEEKFEQRLTTWHDTKRRIESDERAGKEAEQKRNQTFERARGKYQAEAASKRIKGFDDAEKAVLDSLGSEMLGVMIEYSHKPAELVAAVGGNEKFLARVQAETNPLRRVRMLWDAEIRMKTKKNPPPAPEAQDIKRGAAPIAHVSGDKKLDDLRQKAQKTGDFTALSKYKADMRAAGKSV